MKLFKVMSDKFNVNIFHTLSNYPFVYVDGIEDVPVFVTVVNKLDCQVCLPAVIDNVYIQYFTFFMFMVRCITDLY